MRAINKPDDGKEWLTDKQLAEKFDEITSPVGNSLIEANENTQKLLYRTQVGRLPIDIH